MLTNTLYPLGRQHMKTHTRPFPCDEPTCRADFTSRSDRNRHMREVHGPKQYLCTYPGCKYKPARDGMARKENWQRHMWKQHGVQV